MHYFKCESFEINEDFREKHRELSEKERQANHKQKLWKTLGTVVFYAVSFLCLIGFFSFTKTRAPENRILLILYYIYRGIVWLIGILVSGIIGLLCASPIWGKAHTKYCSEKHLLLSQACAQLREYYQLKDSYIITKCFYSSDKAFTNHDVCLFVTNGELRLTVNLIHGFHNPANDLGCYTFQKDEIAVTTQQDEHRVMTKLQCGDMTFLLGIRAKNFIKNTFLDA